MHRFVLIFRTKFSLRLPFLFVLTRLVRFFLIPACFVDGRGSLRTSKSPPKILFGCGYQTGLKTIQWSEKNSWFGDYIHVCLIVCRNWRRRWSNVQHASGTTRSMIRYTKLKTKSLPAGTSKRVRADVIVVVGETCEDETLYSRRLKDILREHHRHERERRRLRSRTTVKSATQTVALGSFLRWNIVARENTPEWVCQRE